MEKISFWNEFSPYLIFRSVQIVCYYSISTIQIFKKWTNAGLFQKFVLWHGLSWCSIATLVYSIVLKYERNTKISDNLKLLLINTFTSHLSVNLMCFLKLKKICFSPKETPKYPFLIWFRYFFRASFFWLIVGYWVCFVIANEISA